MESHQSDSAGIKKSLIEYQQEEAMLTQTAIADPHFVPYRAGVRYPAQPIAKSAWIFGSKEKMFRPNEELFGEGETVDCIYKVIRGAVRSYKSLGKGRRKIEAFRLPGDIFGLDVGAEREFCAEAIDDVSVLIGRRRRGAGAVINCQTVHEELWSVTARELQRVQQHALLLAKNSRQRVACFLVEMSGRLGAPTFLEVPMSRQDIADYLGLTVETVSRTITRFEAKGLIEVPLARQIVFRDLDALRRLTD
jgi:CRP/FNR family nitrogen fixation transcriptional regulator